MKCKAITQKGQPCKRKSQKNSEYCWQHIKMYQNGIDVTIIIVPYINDYCCSKGERICKEILGKLLPHMSFTKKRPDFLRQENGYKLELDLYCMEYELAVEYNGRQHYKYIPFFHQNDRENFEKQKRRDETKKRLCEINCTKLIIVPYTYMVRHNIKKSMYNIRKVLSKALFVHH